MPPKQVVKEDRMSLTLHTDHKQDACQILIFAPKLWTRCQSKGRNVSGFTTLWWPIYWRESKRKYLTAWEEEAIVCTLYHTIPKVHILSEKLKFYFFAKPMNKMQTFKNLLCCCICSFVQFLTILQSGQKLSANWHFLAWHLYLQVSNHNRKEFLFSQCTFSSHFHLLCSSNGKNVSWRLLIILLLKGLKRPLLSLFCFT